MNDVKSWIKSKTIWSVAIMLAPIISAKIGFDMGATLNEIVELIGGAAAIYFRIKARTKLLA